MKNGAMKNDSVLFLADTAVWHEDRFGIAVANGLLPRMYKYNILYNYILTNKMEQCNTIK